MKNGEIDDLQNKTLNQDNEIINYLDNRLLMQIEPEIVLGEIIVFWIHLETYNSNYLF